MAAAQLKQDFDRRVELAGLEPATSWVRFTRGASPPFATVRRLSQPSGFRRNPPRPFAVLRRRYSNGWRSPRVAWRLESCVPQHPPEVDQHPDVNVLSVWSDKHLRLSAERHSVPAVRLLVHVRSEEHTSELQSRLHLVCRLLLGKKKHTTHSQSPPHLVCRLLLENKQPNERTITSSSTLYYSCSSAFHPLIAATSICRTSALRSP